ncbi:MAG: hypothetical protein RLZZ316_480 [Bacteroidota bacterium]|jgi:hypothetical protein
MLRPFTLDEVCDATMLNGVTAAGYPIKINKLQPVLYLFITTYLNLHQ